MASEKNQRKIIETRALLLEIIKNPIQFKNDDNLKKTLKSQVGVAKYSNQERDIDGCSLNTFKTNAESLLDRGFIEIDELRINAKDAIEEASAGSKPVKNTKAGLHHNIKALDLEIETLRKTNQLLSLIINSLRGELKNMAYSTKTVEQRQEVFKEVNKVVGAKLSYTLKGDV